MVLALSGCKERADVVKMAEAGAKGVLVGTSLMRAPAPEDLIANLLGAAPRRPLCKICGLRDVQVLRLNTSPVTHPRLFSRYISVTHPRHFITVGAGRRRHRLGPHRHDLCQVEAAGVIIDGYRWIDGAIVIHLALVASSA